MEAENKGTVTCNGVTYCREMVQHTGGYNCDLCDLNDNLSVCDQLQTDSCSFHYVYKVKEVDIIKPAPTLAQNDKLINGVLYSAKPVPSGDFVDNCKQCCAHRLPVCSDLATTRCARDYIYEIKTDEELKPCIAPSATVEQEGMKFDDGKPQYSLVPPYALAELAKCLTFGAKKYAPDNWKRVSNPKVRYLDAALRHIELVRQGEEYDKESGAHHFTSAMANLAFLVEFEFNPELKGKDNGTI